MEGTTKGNELILRKINQNQQKLENINEIIFNFPCIFNIFFLSNRLIVIVDKLINELFL